MNKNKFALILIVIMVLAILICLVLLENKDGSNDNGEDKSIKVDKDVEIIGDKFKILNNQNIFFSIQNSINEYYENITDVNYVSKIMISEYEPVTYNVYDSYIIKKAYYLNLDNKSIYLVCGNLSANSFADEESANRDNVCYFVLTKNNTIRLKELDIVNMESYLSTLYYKGSIHVDDGIKYSITNTTDESKLSYYLAYFINLLLYNPEEAYTYLDDNMLKYYNSYEVFNEYIYNIYDKLSSVIFSYAEESNTNKKVYRVTDNNQNNIIITENNIMDFKIFINFI